MGDILKLARIQIGILIPFIFFKAIRPYVLKNDYPEFFKLFLLSFPNFCEAIVGVMTVTMLGLVINHKWIPTKHQVKEEQIYILAILLSAIYVILQEFKVHNLGGNNVYDSNDIIFSVVGLGIAYFLVVRIKPRISKSRLK